MRGEFRATRSETGAVPGFPASPSDDSLRWKRLRFRQALGQRAVNLLLQLVAHLLGQASAIDERQKHRRIAIDQHAQRVDFAIVNTQIGHRHRLVERDRRFTSYEKLDLLFETSRKKQVQSSG